MTLEISAAMNAVIFLGYWFFIFPTHDKMYDNSQLQQAFGNNDIVKYYFQLRSIIIHSCPFFVSVCNVLQADVIFME